MKREFLKELGIEGEVVDKIMGEYGKSINSLKAEVEEKVKINAEFEATKKQLEEVQKQLKDFEGSDDTIEELKEKLKTQAGEYEQFKADATKREQNMSKSQKLKDHLSSKFAKDSIDLLVGTFNLDDLSLSEAGEIVDIQAKMERLAEARPSLAIQTKETSKKPPSGETGKDIDTETMSDQEYLDYTTRKE